MLGLRYIEPRIIENAQVRLRDFYYTNTIAVAVSLEVKKDTSLARRDSVLFCFISDDVLLSSITIPITDLVRYEEIWVEKPTVSAGLYANDTFDLYSYSLAKIF